MNDTIDILTKVAADKEDFAYCKEMAQHLDLVATVAVRNVSALMRMVCVRDVDGIRFVHDRLER